MKKLILLIFLPLLFLTSKGHAQYSSVQIFPTPQEILISTQTFIPSSYFLTGIKSVDADAIALLKELLPVSNSKKGTPLKIVMLNDKKEELKRSGAYRLTIHPKSI